MQANAKQTVEISLVMNESEARWLMGVVQNPAGRPQDEPVKESELRCKTFHAIRNALELLNRTDDVDDEI